MIKGAIFDFNGTLFWDDHYHAEAFDVLIKSYLDGKDGLVATPMSKAEMKSKIFGKPNSHIMPIIFGQELSKEHSDRLAEEKEAIYRTLCKGKVTFAPGVYELWQWLKEHDIPFTIASSSDKANIDFFYQETDLAKWVSRDIITYSDGSFLHGKPAPDIFLLAAKRIGVEPAETIVFEDSDSGIRAAEAANANVVMVLDDPAKKYDGPHPVIYDFREAIKFFE
ncbi:MAG: HAD family phosphatase [Bacteroidales bacterium]|nr:HAD family phosphatase [Bacteroidales bacterium]